MHEFSQIAQATARVSPNLAQITARRGLSNATYGAGRSPGSGNESALIVALGAEGGSIALYEFRTERGWSFSSEVNGRRAGVQNFGATQQAGPGVATSVALKLLIRVAAVDGRPQKSCGSSRRAFRVHGWHRRRRADMEFPTSCCSHGARRIAKGSLAIFPDLCRQ